MTSRKVIILTICLVFGLSTDQDGNTDNDECEEYAQEKNDDCPSCINLLDETKEVEENFTVKINELEERHQQRLTDLRMSHNAEMRSRHTNKRKSRAGKGDRRKGQTDE